MTDETKTKRTRLTVEEAWAPRPQGLLVIATDDELETILDDCRDAAKAADLRRRAAEATAKASKLNAEADELLDGRDVLAATLRERMIAEASR